MEDDTWAREGWAGDIQAAKAAEAAQQGQARLEPGRDSSAAGAGADKAAGSKGSAGGMPEAQARDADQQALISQSGGNTAAGNSAGAKAAAQKVIVSVSKSQPKNAEDPGKGGKTGKAGGQSGQAGTWDGPEEALTKEESGKDSDGTTEVGSKLCTYLPLLLPCVANSLCSPIVTQLCSTEASLIDIAAC